MKAEVARAAVAAAPVSPGSTATCWSRPEGSALLVIARRVTPDKFTEALRPNGGTVLKTSLPHDAEHQLMKALHGDDPKAPTWQQHTATVA
jgi:uncharacterized membrane protein